MLTALPGLLDPWKQLKPIGIHIELQSTSPTQRDGHPIGQLMLNVVNDSNTLFSSFNGLVRLPAGVLKHWQATHMGEER